MNFMKFFSCSGKQLLFALIFFWFASVTVHSQCAEIESISIAACGDPEGFNEMLRFRVGPTDLNTADLSVVWTDSQAIWRGLIQNNTTAAKVAEINAQIIAEGGCPLLFEPIGGVLPANSSVILATSYEVSALFTSFAAINETTYIIFQNNIVFGGGHFINATNFFTGQNLRTTVLNFGPSCSETVTYDTNLNSGNRGDSVRFTTDGRATYFNNGCAAPVDPLIQIGGPTIIEQCVGQETVNLSATVTNPLDIQWTATAGSFTAPNSLATTFIAPPAFEGTIRITLTVSNSCGSNTSSETITLTLKPFITPVFSIPTDLCIGDPAPALPSVSDNGATGTWSPAVINNQASGTYIFTPSSDYCASSPTYILDVIVDQNRIAPLFTAVDPICAGDFLAPLPTISSNGISGSWSPALDNTTTTTYTFTPDAEQCASQATMTIVVNPVITPLFDIIGQICINEFLAPLPTTSQNGITGSWSPSINNTTTTTYTFTPDSGQCALPTTQTITVITGEVIFPIIGNNSVCLGETLQLSSAITDGTWSSTDTSIATVDNNGLVTPILPGATTIVYSTPSVCNATSIDITVYGPPNPQLTDQFICVDNTTGEYIASVILESDVPAANHSFVWTLNGQALPTTGNLHVATEEGIYEVMATNTTTLCSATASATVVRSSTAEAEISITADFEQNQTITVDVIGGSGDYLYQFNNNEPQDSNQFIVYEAGEYFVTVIDKNGCGVTPLKIFALNYPRFFTPNNDGFNDTWFIQGLNRQVNTKILLFDRFGKLIKEIRPSLNQSWDGTFNGVPLPADDYWFTLEYIDRDQVIQQFKSHFSLKR